MSRVCPTDVVYKTRWFHSKYRFFFISHITLIKLSIYNVNAVQGRDKGIFVFLFCKAPVLLLILSAWLWLNMCQYLTIRQRVRVVFEQM